MSLFLKENYINGKWQNYEAIIGKKKKTKKKTKKTTNFHIVLLTILFKLSKIKVFLFKKHLTQKNKNKNKNLTLEIYQKKNNSKVK